MVALVSVRWNRSHRSTPCSSTSVASFSRRRSRRSPTYERSVGLPEGAIRSVNSRHPSDNAWARFERSEIGVDEFVSQFEDEAAQLGFGVSGAAVLACLDGDLRPEMVAALRQVAARFATALLTNNVVSMSAAGLGEAGSLHRFAEVLELFDHVIESSVVGVRKPERRFYEIACERAGVVPERVVFLDDLGVNLKPARQMGMTTIKVTDPGDAIDELESLLGIALR